MRRSLLASLAAALALATMLPSTADTIDPVDVGRRFVPRPAGTEKALNLYFGPYAIPPGQDNNRVTLDLPLQGGFYTAVAPNVIDAVTGEEPSDQEMHIHHAHWLRVTTDPSEEYYTTGLSWVFGTGEEKTQGSLDDRSAAVPGGPRYGIYIRDKQPQALIFMLHNKTARAMTVYITLSVRFVYGTAEEIAAAQPGCPWVVAGDNVVPPTETETCAAGAVFHTLTGKLWGTTFDVPRDFNPSGDGTFVYPIDRGFPLGTDKSMYTAPWSGTFVAGAGHLHPNGREVVIANLGKAGSGCQADLDADGFPGVTLIHSRKIEHDAAAFPHSEDYQMAATKPGFRAPIHAGDRIAQYGVYDNGEYASYEAMSYAGMYVDRLQAPAAAPATCTATNWQAAYAPVIVGGTPAGTPTEGMLNHPWGDADPLCGVGTYPACDRAWTPKPDGMATDAVHIGGFLYAPGDMNSPGALGNPPIVEAGSQLTFVNEDAALGIRHTVSSCNWPCNGTYVANYPQPNGVFDSGKLGNLDYIDGGITGDDTVPVWKTPATLAPGDYAYYCRIHPTMRGVFRVVA